MKRPCKVSRRMVQGICRSAVAVLGASGFAVGRMLNTLPDAVALSASSPEREDLGLVWMIADGLESAAGKLRAYCLAWDSEMDEYGSR